MVGDITKIDGDYTNGIVTSTKYVIKCKKKFPNIYKVVQYKIGRDSLFFICYYLIKNIILQYLT